MLTHLEKAGYLCCDAEMPADDWSSREQSCSNAHQSNADKDVIPTNRKRSLYCIVFGGSKKKETPNEEANHNDGISKRRKSLYYMVMNKFGKRQSNDEINSMPRDPDTTHELERTNIRVANTPDNRELSNQCYSNKSLNDNVAVIKPYTVQNKYFMDPNACSSYAKPDMLDLITVARASSPMARDDRSEIGPTRTLDGLTRSDIAKWLNIVDRNRQEGRLDGDQGQHASPRNEMKTVVVYNRK